MLISKSRQFIIHIAVLSALVGACAPIPTQPAPANTTPLATAAPTYTAPAAAVATAALAAASASNGSARRAVVDVSQSEASYAVREQLARLNFPSDAIGKTNAITGSITLNSDGTIDSSSSKFTVDVSTLKSDEALRDRYVARNVLQSDKYPLVVFVPTKVDGFPATLPTSGNLAFTLTGNLTIRDVTKPVTWQVNGTANNQAATGQAVTTFKFEDFNLPQPRVPVVLSVQDQITLTVSMSIVEVP